jgi:arginyl-tRNA synthetase
MKQLIRQQIKLAIEKAFPDLNEAGPVLSEQEIEVNQPPEQFGDYATNVALKLAAVLKKKPLEIAEELKKVLEDFQEQTKEEVFFKIEVQPPGFLNFFLSEKILVEQLGEVLQAGDQYGQSQEGRGQQVMVEFGQPNTHKAVTVGHLRSAISGLAVVKLLENLGYQVVKANYFGDVGMHVAKATWAVAQAGLPKDFEQRDALARMNWINERYVEGAAAFKDNPEAEVEIRAINKEVYAGKGPHYQLYQQLREWSREHQADFFAGLGIQYDREYPESEVYPEARRIVEKYQGEIFQQSQGAWIYDGERAGLTTWVYLTSEGNPTYSSKDLALALKKFEEYPELTQAIVTTSMEQADYFRALIYCLEQIKPEIKGKYQHLPFGWLLMNHKKTSSRMGQTVKAQELLQEVQKVAREKISEVKEYDSELEQSIGEKVALAGLKFLILSHEFHKNINYDPDKFLSLKGFSGPFVLYSYVRTQSVLAQASSIWKISLLPPAFGAHRTNQYGSAKASLPAGRQGRRLKISSSDKVFENSTKKNEEKLSSNFLKEVHFKEEVERRLVKKLIAYPDVAKEAGNQIAPHLVCTYLHEVAQLFNAFYEQCPILKAPDEATQQARLALTTATGQVLKNGLGLLSIETIDQM